MKEVVRILFSVSIGAAMSLTVFADIKVKQRITMSGMKIESTRMIKGSRERTEQKAEMGEAAAAMFPQIATVTQCDLRRKIQINDRKRLFLIEPLQTASETGPATSVSERQPSGPTRQGGTVTMTISARDTGERKTMFGLQARHIITTQEMVSSADSCNGASRSKMEYDGWYVDFSADFSCPVKLPPQRPGNMEARRPGCTDRFVTKATGIGDPGFMLEGTMKIYGPDGTVQMTNTTETLELSRAPLDQAFFEVPNGYAETKDSQDLYKVSASDMASAADRSQSEDRTPVRSNTPVGRSVGINVVLASGAQANQPEIEEYIRGKIEARGLRAIAGTGDHNLKIEFRQIKESTGSKVGGIFGKVTGVDTKAGSVTIDLIATLSGGGEARVKNKFDGPLDNAVRAALDQALDQLLANIN
ncbi:MAG TPA: hypothetical protein VJ781_10145 [Pyrinomonadaceae bacterium]|nr:hypothetical protein [Pyrinomonadaceae bacterium]